MWVRESAGVAPDVNLWNPLCAEVPETPQKVLMTSKEPPVL